MDYYICDDGLVIYVSLWKISHLIWFNKDCNDDVFILIQ